MPDLTPQEKLIEYLIDQRDEERAENTRLRAALGEIANMPVRYQPGNKLAENPGITREIAVKALNPVRS